MPLVTSNPVSHFHSIKGQPHTFSLAEHLQIATLEFTKVQGVAGALRMVVIVPMLIQILPLFRFEGLDPKVRQRSSHSGLRKRLDKLDHLAVLKEHTLSLTLCLSVHQK